MDMTTATSLKQADAAGRNTPDSAAVVQALSRALADSYVLSLKTQGVHWNVIGPLFHSLHTLTEAQYAELALAVDAIAERIRALGALAPATWSGFAALSAVSEETRAESAEAQARQLADDHATTAARLREGVELAEEAGDPATADLLTQRIAGHDKAAWMLRALAA
jgi:starvation-inducible DNA-binding protein